MSKFKLGDKVVWLDGENAIPGTIVVDAEPGGDLFTLKFTEETKAKFGLSFLHNKSYTPYAPRFYEKLNWNIMGHSIRKAKLGKLTIKDLL